MIDWTLVLVAIITAVPPTLAILVSARKIEAQVERVHKATNSIVTQLVDTTAKSSKAEGKLEEANEEAARRL
jgi:hypothetical protein